MAGDLPPAGPRVPSAVRGAAWLALGTAVVHVVFGAVVRISGSGMGCGDHWPKCYGYWFPPFSRMDLVIEVLHRYLAVGLFVAIAALLVAAWRARPAPGISGRGGVLRAAGLATGLWFAPALFGAVTVYTGNPAWATVVHKLLAASLIGVLVAAVVRASVGASVGARPAEAAPARAVGGAVAAAALALLTVLMGGLTAKLPDAAIACRGFPLCGEGSLGGGAQHVQLTHRVLAYLLVLHLWSLPFAWARQGAPAALRRLAAGGAALGTLQVGWAMWMVLGGFPAVVRSAHQATGILLWVVGIAMVFVSRRAGASGEAVTSGRTAPMPTLSGATT
ncbi:MAG: COX15/CtaA family protein [Gemmatimonadota bacterium]|jgi:cytochrome c oxidase assembly protein subunit 15|nr:COX15/CtaA family protein [Gemmatimonadota bacterium]